MLKGFMNLPKLPPVHFGSGERYPLFHRLQIETARLCNRTCSFCPCANGTRKAGTVLDDGSTVKQDLLPRELFDKAILEAAALGFDGVLSLFLLNEPMLDPRMHDLLRFAGTRVPNASIYLSTNADALGRDPEKAAEKLATYFDAGLTVCNLNAYDGGDAGIEQLRRYARIIEIGAETGRWRQTLRKYSKHNPRRSFVCVTDMRPERTSAMLTDKWYDKNEGLKDWSAPGIEAYCMRPMRHLVVEYDGRVPLCCAIDTTTERALRVGDLRTQTLLEIWESETMYMHRYMLQQKRRELPGCRGCNHTMAYAHVTRRVSADVDAAARWEQHAAEGLDAGALEARSGVRGRRALPVLSAPGPR